MNALDLAILRLLQQNGRRSNADLARELGVASSTVYERVRKLEQRGFISGYRALIDPESVGFGAQALVTATLAYDQIEAVQEFQDAVGRIPEVRACYGVAGRYDYILHIVARDLRHLRDVLHTRINTIPASVKTETFIILGEVKPDTGLPLDPAETPPLDAPVAAPEGGDAAG